MSQLEGTSYIINKNPKKIIILLHGYGDNAENFISIAENLNHKFSKLNYFAPNAPFIVPQYPLGRQWFDPYPNGIHYDKLGETEKEILLSINKLREYLEKLIINNSLTYEDVFILGFSQGAMIAYEFGNYINQHLAGCIMISGRILSNEKKTNTVFAETPLLLMHGDSDDVVSPKYFNEAAKIAELNKFFIEKYLIKDQSHSISLKLLQIVQKFLQKYSVT